MARNPSHKNAGRAEGPLPTPRQLETGKARSFAHEAGGREVRFQAVLENIQDGFLTLDRDYTCTYANQAAATILNTTADMLIGQVIWNAFPPPRYPRLHEEITRAAEQKVFVKLEEYCEACGRWYEWHCYPTDDTVAIFLEDISERKQAQEQVVRSEQHYRLLFETMPEGVVYQDAEGKIISMNPAAEQILGRTPAEFLGRTSVDEEHHTLREDGTPFPGLEHPSMVALRIGQEVRNVVMGVFNPRLHAYRWINITAVPLVRPGEDKPYQVYTHFGDITELRQAERALRHSERRFRKLFEADLMGIFITKPDGTFLDCNDTMVKILGYSSREEVLHRQSSELYVDPEFRREAVRILQQEGVYLGQEGRVWRKDGSIAHLLGAAVLLKDEETGEPYIQGVAVDITERKRTEEALRESEERYRKLFEANLAGVYITKLDGTILDFNDAMMKMLGYDSRAEVFQKQSSDFYADPAFRQELIRLLLQDGIVPGKEAFLQRKDGSALYALGAAVLLTDERTGERYIQGVAVDITERKQAEEALRQSERAMRDLTATLESKVAQRTAELEHRARQLQKLTLELSEAEDQERKRLAEILHDDLQQVLAGAKFHVGLMRSQVKHDPALQALAAQIEHMLKDAIGKSRSLSHELSPAVMHHADFAETLRWLANEVQAKHGLVVHVQADGPVRAHSEVLKAFLYRAAQEMLFNVVKHSQVKEARIRVRRWGPYICLSVSDRGRGFDPKELREAIGFGLLSIRERIESLGGRMKIKSAKGRGSTFFMAAPNGEAAATGFAAEAESTGGAEEAEQPARADAGRLRVLLADDHEIVRQGLVSLLSEEHRVEIIGEAANGREAVDLADQLAPDVVIMDVSMPVVNGEEATRQIKTHRPQTRVVAFSMCEEPEVAERMHQAGAESYVLKTAPSEELLAAIRGQESNPAENPA